MTDKKNVHILVPRGFQNKELLRATRGISHDASDTPSDGECITCKGTGAIFHKIWLENFHVVDGRILNATPKMAWFRCKCGWGQFWIRFHPINVRARLFPKWRKEIREALEQEKARIIRESGGSYDPYSDTFLDDLGYKTPKTNKVESLDEILRRTLAKKGDFII